VNLPNSYTIKTNSIPEYFDAMLNAQPPERFSQKFLENLGFTSTNDRLFIGILKDLGFLNQDGTPQSRYYEFLDRSRSKQVLAAGIREAFQELFAVNTKAYDLTSDEARNKLRTLYAGSKTDLVIGNVARTFRALCDYADFNEDVTTELTVASAPEDTPSATPKDVKVSSELKASPTETQPALHERDRISPNALQYHINIVLPDSRDQAVYDAIFRSLREHLG
jgi:Family of unknown function (DUF5343)